MGHGKNMIAACMAFLLAFVPLAKVAHADALDALAVAVEGAVSISQEDDQKITAEILETMAKDPAQKSVLQEHITKMKSVETRLEGAQGTIFTVSAWLHGVPLLGGMLTTGFLECVEWYWEREFSRDDDPEIVRRYETLRSHFLDAEADYIGLLADAANSEAKENGLMKSINGIQLLGRMGSAKSAMKRARMAAFDENPEEKGKKGASAKEKMQEKPQKGAAADPREKAKQELESLGYSVSGQIKETSYGNSSVGFLARETGTGKLVVCDRKNHRVAVVEPITDFSVLTHKQAGHEVFETRFYVANDARDNDRNAGYWDGATHVFNVYGLFDRDGAGNVVPGKLYTASGRKPSHYHSVLYEQKNVDLMNLVMTEAKSLR